MDKLFIETSAQINMVFGTENDRAKICNLKKDKKIITSNYIIGELSSNILHDAITLYNLLIDNSVADSLVLFDRVFFSSAQESRARKVLARMIGLHGDDRGAILKRLDYFINRHFKSIFIRQFDEIIKVIECERCNVTIKKSGSFWIYNKANCTRANKENLLCKADNIFAEIEDRMEECFKTHLPKSKMVEVFKEVKEDHKKVYGRNCWRLGDFFIAYEQPLDSYLCTYNLKDYEGICKVLGKNICEI